MRYVEIANRDPEAASNLGETMRATVGPSGLIEAAATVAIFNGLVRSADAIGIPLDDVVASNTANDRSTLGINEYAGAFHSKADGG